MQKPHQTESNARTVGHTRGQIQAGLTIGTILQMMYLRTQLAQIPVGTFVEVGGGDGYLTMLLLSMGWHGIAVELDTVSAEKLKTRFAKEISTHQLDVVCTNFLTYTPPQSVDLVISSMVIEHLPDDQESQFVANAHRMLHNGGRIIILTPLSPAHWGIEDDVAGHVRRYTRERLNWLIATHQFHVVQLVGLTYPVSNLLLPLSNALVYHHESSKLAIDQYQRTLDSGHRNVPLKTYVPLVFRVITNEYALWPLYIIQNWFHNHPHTLVGYIEAIKNDPTPTV
jgi:2-polyprenyl-3-methyl-5-hydroxy-6-metoxy-1,4-benzoquinol methylase